MSLLRISCKVLRITQLFTTFMAIFACIEVFSFWLTAWLSIDVQILPASVVSLVLSALSTTYTAIAMGWSTCFSVIGLLSSYGAIFDAITVLVYIAQAVMSRSFVGANCSDLTELTTILQGATSQSGSGAAFPDLEQLCEAEQFGFAFFLINCFLFASTTVLQGIIWKKRNSRSSYKQCNDIELVDTGRLTPHAREETSIS